MSPDQSHPQTSKSPSRDVTALPPGQIAIEGFPRFGGHFHHPPPPVPTDPKIEITGVLREEFSVSLARFAELPRKKMTANFHCVSGWSALGLRWEGVEFSTFYRQVIEPALRPDVTVTDLTFTGVDTYRSIVTIADALGEDGLIADQLHGEPLTPKHGAPLRLVSPSQYGFISTKHLCRIEVHASRPPERYHSSPLLQTGFQIVKPHPKARV